MRLSINNIRRFVDQWLRIILRASRGTLVIFTLISLPLGIAGWALCFDVQGNFQQPVCWREGAHCDVWNLAPGRPSLWPFSL